jgi:hypothetical protein
VSAAVAREVVIKKAVGKVEVPADLGRVMAENRFLARPLTVAVNQDNRVSGPSRATV